MEVIDRGLRWVVGAAEELVAALKLVPKPLSPKLTELRARPRPLVMRTRRWYGPGWSALTVATIEDEHGSLRTATVIGLPASSVLPIVSVELSALDGALGPIAVDLAPTDMAYWSGHCARHLSALRRAVGGAMAACEWPSLASESCSALALIGAARGGGEGLALAAIAGFLRTLPEVLRGAPQDPDRAAAAASQVRTWLAAERRGRREPEALASLFGAATADAYLGELLRVDAAA